MKNAITEQDIHTAQSIAIAIRAAESFLERNSATLNDKAIASELEFIETAKTRLVYYLTEK